MKLTFPTGPEQDSITLSVLFRNYSDSRKSVPNRADNERPNVDRRSLCPPHAKQDGFRKGENRAEAIDQSSTMPTQNSMAPKHQDRLKPEGTSPIDSIFYDASDKEEWGSSTKLRTNCMTNGMVLLRFQWNEVLAKTRSSRRGERNPESPANEMGRISLSHKSRK